MAYHHADLSQPREAFRHLTNFLVRYGKLPQKRPKKNASATEYVVYLVTEGEYKLRNLVWRTLEM
jgi:hypothetical protein